MSDEARLADLERRMDEFENLYNDAIDKIQAAAGQSGAVDKTDDLELRVTRLERAFKSAMGQLKKIKRGNSGK